MRAEGRNYLRSKRNSYDTIVMSGVDTFSALNSGAYVLSENYLYTVEAIEDYLSALKPAALRRFIAGFFSRVPGRACGSPECFGSRPSGWGWRIRSNALW